MRTADGCARVCVAAARTPAGHEAPDRYALAA